MSRAAAVVVLGLFACASPPSGESGSASLGEESGGGGEGSGGGSTTTQESGARYTYWRDAKAILDARCATCHRAGDVGPFALETAEQAAEFAPLLPASIMDGTMPPWPPSAACNSYQHDRSLRAEEREVLLGWVEEGAPIGDPADEPPRAAPEPAIAWDLDLMLPEPYAPRQSPDDYRCFVIGWPEDQLKYVTGFDVAPDQRPIVHHTIAYLVPPGSVKYYRDLDAAEDGPGYTCFGSPGGGYGLQWLGAWAPGASPSVDPSRGIAVQPGSAVVLQMHYHPTPDPPADRTRVRVKLADTVKTPLYVVPFTNPNWLEGQSMTIPAGKSGVVHDFQVDLTDFIGDFFPGAGVSNGEPFVIHGVSLHMHTRGTRASLELARKDGSEACGLYIPRWDFDWQGSYKLTEPLAVAPGDQLRLTCEWDNSAANQPVEGGQQIEPVDVFWGEGTGDEMCLAVLTISPQ